jgi:hypothetical protein
MIMKYANLFNATSNARDMLRDTWCEETPCVGCFLSDEKSLSGCLKDELDSALKLLAVKKEEEEKRGWHN